ncbi:MAG: DinB family protein [Dehalococcoidia bacterium]
MTAQTAQFTKDVLDRNEAILMQAMEGLTPADLHAQPGQDSNPIGWLMWHLSRVQDNHVSAMAGKQHVWVTDGWNARFGRDGFPVEDRGRGHTPEQVREFKAPDGAALVAYYKAVRAETNKFLDGLSEADLNRPVPAVEGDSTVPLRIRLEMVVVDGLQHSGQIAYLRGLLQGKGWLAS